MFTIDDIKNEYRRLDAVTGADTSQIPLRISTRFTRKLGMCRLSAGRNGRYAPTEIVIGEQILCADEEVFYDTIRHEYAHALVAIRDGHNHGHDATWKKACIEVGCRPHASVKSDTLGDVVRMAEPGYIVRCKKCGHEIIYYRKGKVVSSLMKGRSPYRCRCGGKLEVVVK